MLTPCQPENFACPCTRVHFPLHTDVQSGYIEAQYAWLEELLALSESATPAFDISCSGGLYQEASFATVFRAYVTLPPLNYITPLY
jgi:hypothetical protein